MAAACITIDTEFPDQPARDALGTVDELLEVLASHSVKATFFIVGAWAKAHPDRVRAIHEAGHHIGNHSYSHCSLARMTAEGIVDDLVACHDVLAELGIESRPWFRAPYGETDGNSATVMSAIKTAGYRHIHWHARGEDWRPGQSAQDAAEMVLRDVGDRWPRPAIILMHSWPDCAAQALELTIDRLAMQGATFLTLEHLGVRHAVIGRLREAAPWTR
ncbi:MAG: polysaccharide deacetylase family protein [Solirubrobacteraceae bacterium]